MLEHYLDAAAAVNITGARATGKTTTAMQAANSSLQLTASAPNL